MSKRRMRVYIAGPMTGSGNPYGNIEHGMSVAGLLLDHGYAPYCPHLLVFLEMSKGIRSRDVWLELERVFLVTCDAVLRLGGESPGADSEVTWAREAGIPVYYSLDTLFACERPLR